MTNRSRVVRIGRRRAAVGISIAVALAIPVIALAQSDSGGSMTCRGFAKLDRSKPKSEHALSYSFRCSKTLRSFSIVSNKEVDAFDTAVPPGAEDLKCQGEIPGNGFSCTGDKGATAAPGVKLSGGLGTTNSPCGGARPRLWLVGVDEDAASSEPVQLRGPKCPRRKRRH